MKTKILGLMAAVLLVGPMASHAASLSLANPNPTAVRPATGTVTVDFFGTLSLDDPADTVRAFSIDGLFNGSGVVLDSVLVPAFSSMTDAGNALRFSWAINSTAAPGLYSFDSASLIDPSTFSLTFRSAVTGADYTVSDTFSINLVEPQAVPEPGTLALLWVGLAGLGMLRRHRIQIRPAR
jgi:hypothetical protein